MYVLGCPHVLSMNVHLVARLYPPATEPEVRLRDALPSLQPIPLAFSEGCQHVRAGQRSDTLPRCLPSPRS